MSEPRKSLAPTHPPHKPGVSGLRLRLSLTSHDVRVLDTASSMLVATARDKGARTYGPIPLPTSLVAGTQLSAHRRLIDILDPPANLTETFIRTILPAGVSVEVSF